MLVRLDLETGERQSWKSPARCFVGESIVVPRPQPAGSEGEAPEDFAYLLSCAYDAEAAETRLMVFDARCVLVRLREASNTSAVELAEQLFSRVAVVASRADFVNVAVTSLLAPWRKSASAPLSRTASTATGNRPHLQPQWRRRRCNMSRPCVNGQRSLPDGGSALLLVIFSH